MNYFLAVILLKTSDMPSNIHCLRHTPSGGPIVYHTPTQLAMLSEEKLHVFPYVVWSKYDFFILMFFLLVVLWRIISRLIRFPAKLVQRMFFDRG